MHKFRGRHYSPFTLVADYDRLDVGGKVLLAEDSVDGFTIKKHCIRAIIKIESFITLLRAWLDFVMDVEGRLIGSKLFVLFK